MVMSVTKFRQNLYKVLDQIIETGIPLELKRKGRNIKIICEKPSSKLNNLKAHNIINGDPKHLADISWENEWQNEHI